MAWQAARRRRGSLKGGFEQRNQRYLFSTDTTWLMAMLRLPWMEAVLLGLQPLDDGRLPVHQREHAGGGIADEGEVDRRLSAGLPRK